MLLYICPFLSKLNASIHRFRLVYACHNSMLTKDKKQKVIKKVQMSANDTGSSLVQIALLTERIKELSSHLKEHKKDNHSRRGLIKMVAKRRSHLTYLGRKDKKAFDKITKELKLA